MKFERLFALNPENTARLSNIETLLKAFTEKQEKQERQFRSRFLISGAKCSYTIQVKEIAYFYSEEKITFAVTKDKRTHIIDFSLNKLEEQLDSKMFLRVNRQFILSADAVKSIQSYFNGRISVTLSPEYKTPIQVSREKTALFKLWLNS